MRSPLVSATVGGLTVAGVFLALGVTGRRTVRTVIDEAPLAAEPASGVATGLTPYEIYEADAPSVVFVQADLDQTVQSEFALGPEQPSSVSTGSGFVIDKRGDILTSYHVIEGAGADDITVEFEHGVKAAAELVAGDPSADIAVLRVDPRGLPLDPLSLGDSATARVGDPTLEISNPSGLDRTLTEGIVSSLQRQITAPNGFAVDDVIQTDTPLFPGRSGSPLIDASGRVIGIDSQIETGSGGTVAPVGFAVPINTAKTLLPRLPSLGAPRTAYLGLDGVTIDGSIAALGVRARRGVLVQSVAPASPAAKIGLRAGTLKREVNGQPVYLGGDVIERIDGAAADSAGDLGKVVASKRPGQVVSLTVLRGSTVETLRVTLAGGSPSK